MATKNAPAKKTAPVAATKPAGKPAKFAGKAAAAPATAAKNKPATKPVKAAAPAEGAGRGRARFSGRYGADAVITLHVVDNPKRGASRERYALYKDGMTVAEYVNAGGYMADISHDVKKEFISVAG